MNSAGVEKSGKRYTVKKNVLLLYVEEIERTETQEVARRQHTLKRIDHDAEQWRAVRSHVHKQEKNILHFPIIDEIACASFTSLPPGVDVEPGLIVVRFDPNDPEEACQRLFALSKALVSDLGGFIRLMQGKAVSEETAVDDLLAELEHNKLSGSL